MPYKFGKWIGKAKEKFFGMARPKGGGRDWKAIIEQAETFINSQRKVSIRQVYYHLVANGFLRKDERDYQVLDGLLVERRLQGDFKGKIVDISRIERGGDYGDDSVEDFIESRIHSISFYGYHKTRWDNQPDYIEVWVEKEALHPIIQETTKKYNVTSMATRGFTSITSLEEFGERALFKSAKNVFILLLTDLDPSGLKMETSLRRNLSILGIDATVERIALTEDQIDKYDKRDLSNEEENGSLSWELDVLESSELKEVVEEAIKEHIDSKAWKETEEEEEKDEELLEDFKSEVSDIFEEFEEKLRDKWKEFKDSHSLDEDSDSLDGV